MRSRLASIVVASGLALAACGGGSSSEDGTASTAATTGATGTSAGDSGGEAATELLSFQAQAVDGSTVDLGDFAGSDLVIWFWAPW